MSSTMDSTVSYTTEFLVDSLKEIIEKNPSGLNYPNVAKIYASNPDPMLIKEIVNICEDSVPAKEWLNEVYAPALLADIGTNFKDPRIAGMYKIVLSHNVPMERFYRGVFTGGISSTPEFAEIMSKMVEFGASPRDKEDKQTQWPDFTIVYYLCYYLNVLDMLLFDENNEDHIPAKIAGYVDFILKNGIDFYNIAEFGDDAVFDTLISECILRIITNKETPPTRNMLDTITISAYGKYYNRGPLLLTHLRIKKKINDDLYYSSMKFYTANEIIRSITQYEINSNEHNEATSELIGKMNTVLASSL